MSRLGNDVRANITISRSSVNRTFCGKDINKVPQQKRDRAKMVKE